METTYQTSNFSWDHAFTPGRRIVPPNPDDMVPVLQEDGSPLVNPDDNEPVLRPKDDWQPTFEDIALDTIVLYEALPQTQSVNIFKFATDKESLARILAFYVQFLDAEGRQEVYSTLKETSDIVIPTVDMDAVDVAVQGGRRERRTRG